MIADELDRKLLTLLQKEIPRITRPFTKVAELLGIEEEKVLRRVHRLKDEEKVIRQISAIFDTKSLGYKSTLVAMRFAPEDLDQGAEVINQHPGVSHNYKRNADFNLWFTIAVPPKDSLESHINRLHELSGAKQTLILPTLRLFKIGVKLDLTGKESKEESADDIYDESRRRKSAPDLSETEIEVIRILQEDMPLAEEPYRALAAQIGVSEGELFDILNSFQSRGYMRRIAAILHHRRAGFAANAMVVWNIPKEKLDTIGPDFAKFREVSHCYERPTFPDWPYSVYTMVHGAKMQDCEAIVERMEEKIGKWPHLNLYSTKEYKKIRLKYFTKELDEWWGRTNEKAVTHVN
ncbi:MAG: Lrp/AsnC family transcriptional regulator [Candidatus Omnitrophica bacterium]|nr:Lrp/AsnC family transcriptional regulator [Candidatus Omnitrophota bacterium]